MGHLQRIDGARNTKKTYQANLHQEDKARWKDDVENDTRKRGIVNWGKVAQDRDGWRRTTGETLVLLGQWSNRRRILLRNAGKGLPDRTVL